jgi:hypothetical protein
VYRTTNAFAPAPAWLNVGPPVNIPHNAIAIDPTDPDVVWVGTDLGVWKGIDVGARPPARPLVWFHHGPLLGMPRVAVFDVQVHPVTGAPVAFTHGRGAFVLGASGPGKP